MRSSLVLVVVVSALLLVSSSLLSGCDGASAGAGDTAADIGGQDAAAAPDIDAQTQVDPSPDTYDVTGADSAVPDTHAADVPPDIQTEDIQAEDIQAEDIQGEDIQVEDVQVEDVQAEDIQVEVVQVEDTQAEDVPPTPPSVTVAVETPSEAAGTVELRFTLTADEAITVPVAVEYRQGGVPGYAPASQPGFLANPSPLELSATPDGATHVYRWASIKDLGKGQFPRTALSVVVGNDEEAEAPVAATAETEEFTVTNGAYLREAELTFGVICYEGALLDVEPDGDLDLALACDGLSRLLLNDGDGGFSEALPGTLPVLEGETFGVVVGDLDGDDAPDLVFAVGHEGDGDGQNRVFLNNGHGTFADVTADVMPAHRDQSEKARLLDYDRDGDLDLWFVNSGSQLDRLYRNELIAREGGGGGVFVDASAALPTTADGDGFMGSDGAAGDLDGDGAPDLAVANFVSSQGLQLLRNTWDGADEGAFVDRSADWYPNGTDEQATAFGMLMDVEFFDADGDGDLDIYCADSAGQDRILLNEGDGRMQHSLALPSDLTWGSWKSTTLDLELDGDRDVYLANSSVTDRLLLNDGDGALSDAPGAVFQQTEYGEDSATRGVLAGDLDGDGDDDIIVLRQGTASLILWNREAP